MEKEGRGGKGKGKKGRKKRKTERMRENNITQFYYRVSIRKAYASPFYIT